MVPWLILAGLAVLAAIFWIVRGQLRPAAPEPPPLRVHPKTQPGVAPAFRLSRCPRCGAYRVAGALCHDSRGYPRG